MSTAQPGSPRLSGNQVVVIVLALCAALVLAPVAVYAAKVQKVKVVGTVPTKAKGTTQVAGTVTARQAPDSKTMSAFVVSDATVQSVFGTSATVYLTSITFTNTNPAASYGWIYRYDATCTTQIGYFTYVAVPASNTVNVVFPTPVKLNQACALVHANSGVSATLTAYRA